MVMSLQSSSLSGLVQNGGQGDYRQAVCVSLSLSLSLSLPLSLSLSLCLNSTTPDPSHTDTLCLVSAVVCSGVIQAGGEAGREDQTI